MNTLSLAGTAFIAIAHMSLFYWLMDRFQIGSARARPMIRNFTIPEKSYLSPTAFVLHLIAGSMFTALYAYLLVHIQGESFGLIVSIGTLIGFTHGVFLVFFALQGFSGLVGLRIPTPSVWMTALLTILSHALFGTVVGLGVAMDLKLKIWPTFMAWGLGSLAFFTLLGVAGPHILKHRPWSRGDHPRRDVSGKSSVASVHPR